MNHHEYRRSVDLSPPEAAGVELPAEVAVLFGGRQAAPEEGSYDQAFSLITVAPAGHPHVLMLSHYQIELSSQGRELLVSVQGRQTRSNLKDRPQATLVCVTGDAAHYLKCTVLRDIEDAERGGYAMRVDEHESDSAGVKLSPLSFEFSPELAASERWDLDREVLANLAAIA